MRLDSSLKTIGLSLAWMCLAANAAMAAGAPDPDIGSLAASDTLRTNLWLAQALMRDIVREASVALPPAPAPLLLTVEAQGPAAELFTTVAAGLLAENGYELYQAPGVGEAARDTTTGKAARDTTAGQSARDRTAANTAKNAATAAAASIPADYEIRFQLEEMRLEYPETGRRFGIWRQWVARDMALSALVTIVQLENGRILLSDRIHRSFRDRVSSNQFKSVRSDLYDFTDADLQESGWRRRLEEMVVIGTLTGLVAIYFANTGN
jgi:hypothetical protein